MERERIALAELAALLLDRAGLKISPDGYYGLRLALGTRMPECGLSDPVEYVRRLRGPAGEAELRSLLPLVTVGKTDFFRDDRQFLALERRLLPELLARVRGEGRPALLWSAGCATGEEPYSLAMLLCELQARPEEAGIVATDVNRAALAHAEQGDYPVRKMAGVSAPRLSRFFQASTHGMRLAEPPRAFVRFEPLNLAAPVADRFAATTVDLILCRNVIIYFDVATIRRLMDGFLQALRPGGFLLLGYSESLFNIHDRFEMVEIEGTFVYRRRMEVDRAPPPPNAEPKPALQPQPFPLAPAVTPRTRLADAVVQMEKGDFVAALAALKDLHHAFPEDLDVLLTLGNLYSLLGHNDEARRLFDQVLAEEPLCVEARVFGGVAALQAGAWEEARVELTKAIFLEPTLGVAHYLLAQILEKKGDREGARRAYRNAVAQLQVPQRPLAGHYPEFPDSNETLLRAARYALAVVD